MPGEKPLWFSQRSCGEKGAFGKLTMKSAAFLMWSLVERGIGAAELPREHDRKCDLVQLEIRPVLLAVHRRVLRERAVRLLLLDEQVVERAVGARRVAGRDQRGGDLVQVARPDEVVGARRVLDLGAAPDPRHRGRGDVAAAVRLVLVRGQRHHRDVVERALAAGALRDGLQGAEVGVPARLVGGARRGEAGGERRPRALKGSRVVGPETERDGELL